MGQPTFTNLSSHHEDLNRVCCRDTPLLRQACSISPENSFLSLIPNPLGTGTFVKCNKHEWPETYSQKTDYQPNGF